MTVVNGNMKSGMKNRSANQVYDVKISPENSKKTASKVNIWAASQLLRLVKAGPE